MSTVSCLQSRNMKPEKSHQTVDTVHKVNKYHKGSDVFAFVIAIMTLSVH